MWDPKDRSQGTEPPPSSRGHPLPRRATPEKSVTLRHHRLARDASIRANPASAGRTSAEPIGSTPARRNSSGDSYDTGNSDPKKWFDHSNFNPTATFNGQAMEVDPPFFQKESDSSNGNYSKSFRLDTVAGPRATLKPNVTQSSSSDDYRSVIDDLTVEIQRLKEELRRYKQNGPESLRNEKLFEIKVHGLPQRKKRELEATLREFAASLDGTNASNSASNRKKSSRNIYSDRSMSKHASSSSGSRSRPADSAYHSMSTGHNSSGRSMSRPSMNSRVKSSDQKVQNYLDDIPEGLYPRHMTMTDKEKRKMVVRRLEQLFTGKISGRSARRQQPEDSNASKANLGPIVTEAQQPVATALLTKAVRTNEPSREARIFPSDAKKPRSRENLSASNSNGEIESGGNSGNGGSGGNNSGNTSASPIAPLPEQRPTRPRDLDPDRVQIPSENMEYIRHLGLVPPELMAQRNMTKHDVSPDADGWVYLNLLCNLAQLHMVNVTPSFIRHAVSEKSTKFQLSPDGRKIRWRGGSEGTKFSSDSSGDNSQNSPSTDDSTPNKDGPSRKRTKVKHSLDDKFGSSNNPSKLHHQTSGSTEIDAFHYKPLFTHHASSHEQTSADDTWSSFGPGEESNPSGWGQARSGGSLSRRKRKLDGAIIYYSGAPFCTDLSGDLDGTSGTDADSSIQGLPSRTPPKDETFSFARQGLTRSDSGSLLPFRPLSQKNPANVEMNFEGPGMEPQMLHGLKQDAVDDSDDSDDDIEIDLSWSKEPQVMHATLLEPSGLGGVLPEDHFVVVVTTRRPKYENLGSKDPPSMRRKSSDETADSIIGRLETMTTRSSPGGPPALIPKRAWRESRHQKPGPIELEYVTGRIKRLPPVPLPPPAIFFPPFSTDGSGNSLDMGSEETGDDTVSSSVMSRRANLHHSENAYPDEGLSSDDEEGDMAEEGGGVSAAENTRVFEQVMEEDDDEDDEEESSEEDDVELDDSRARPVVERGTSVPIGHGSSAATAGGRESGYSSSEEQTSE